MSPRNKAFPALLAAAMLAGRGGWGAPRASWESKPPRLPRNDGHDDARLAKAATKRARKRLRAVTTKRALPPVSREEFVAAWQAGAR